MSWHWRYQDDGGALVDPAQAPRADAFSTQSDAETWLGEIWRELLAAGVASVTLLDGERRVYGPMGLHVD